MANDLLFVNFKYQVIDARGDIIQETPMQFYSGFVGVDEDTETYAIAPRIGWLVRKGEPAKLERFW
jgi:hypothetical protein